VVTIARDITKQTFEIDRSILDLCCIFQLPNTTKLSIHEGLKLLFSTFFRYVPSISYLYLFITPLLFFRFCFMLFIDPLIALSHTTYVCIAISISIGSIFIHLILMISINLFIYSNPIGIIEHGFFCSVWEINQPKICFLFYKNLIWVVEFVY